ncbi:MAG: hypothetical protein BMS9Abin12_1313 [Acidimicrobiia bacterium]|nr:MAG: hypothetical protein BMS9Abin12_1313 [Acidimicrobiia bacterium]
MMGNTAPASHVSSRVIVMCMCMLSSRVAHPDVLALHS